MNRRAFVLAGLLSSTSLESTRAASGIQVIYIGGWDCPPCIGWKNTYKKVWLESPEFKQVTWIEIDAPHLTRAYDDAYWPVKLRSIRDQLPVKSGTPRFLIVKNGQIIANRFRGGDYWTGTVADIKKALSDT
jgi:hypothetical protein